MKILNITFSKGLGGLEQTFIDYTKALELQGNEVISIIHSKSKITSNAEAIRINAFSKYDPFAFIKLAHLIKKEKPDAILTHGNKAHSITKIARNLSNQKVLHIGVCHSDGFNIIKKTDYIISVGKKLLDNLLASGFKKEKSTCINNMIDLSDSHNNRTPSTTTRIGFLGRFDNCKGADLFIEALSKVKSNGINFKAIIGGDGEEREKLTRIAIDRGIQESIEMIGWVEDKEKFFNNIDILCVPSREESFGIVILEAMKYGVPVIASNVSGPSEIITHGTDGLLFKSEDIEDLAAKIKELFSSDELRTKLRNNGSKTVQQYDISKVSKQLNDTIATWVKDNK